MAKTSRIASQESTPLHTASPPAPILSYFSINLPPLLMYFPTSRFIARKQNIQIWMPTTQSTTAARKLFNWARRWAARRLLRRQSHHCSQPHLRQPVLRPTLLAHLFYVKPDCLYSTTLRTIPIEYSLPTRCRSTTPARKRCHRVRTRALSGSVFV